MPTRASLGRTGSTRRAWQKDCSNPANGAANPTRPSPVDSPGADPVTLVALGVGAQRSPRYAAAGLLVLHRGRRVMIDGGGGAVPRGRLDAWLVTDDRAELIADIRRLARRWRLIPRAASFRGDGLTIERKAVAHTSHPTYGYRIRAQGRVIVWAPEFMRFPRWARGAELMFAEAAGWDRPIRFAGGVGGHLDVVSVARAARDHGVKRLGFAHIGRPTLRALDRHARPPFGEFAVDGQRFAVPRPGASAEADASARCLRGHQREDQALGCLCGGRGGDGRRRPGFGPRRRADRLPRAGPGQRARARGHQSSSARRGAGGPRRRARRS